jgi:mRNA interferase MazF
VSDTAEPWAPEAGDLIWVDFSPTAGTEQTGRRPALVLSSAQFNRQSGRAVVLPVTSRLRDFPFQIALPLDAPVTGAAMADQVRTIDWRARFAKLGGAVDEALLNEARSKVAMVIGLG